MSTLVRRVIVVPTLILSALTIFLVQPAFAGDSIYACPGDPPSEDYCMYALYATLGIELANMSCGCNAVVSLAVGAPAAPEDLPDLGDPFTPGQCDDWFADECTGSCDDLTGGDCDPAEEACFDAERANYCGMDVCDAIQARLDDLADVLDQCDNPGGPDPDPGIDLEVIIEVITEIIEVITDIDVLIDSLQAQLDAAETKKEKKPYRKQIRKANKVKKIAGKATAHANTARDQVADGNGDSKLATKSARAASRLGKKARKKAGKLISN